MGSEVRSQPSTVVTMADQSEKNEVMTSHLWGMVGMDISDRDEMRKASKLMSDVETVGLPNFKGSSTVLGGGGACDVVALLMVFIERGGACDEDATAMLLEADEELSVPSNALTAATSSSLLPAFER